MSPDGEAVPTLTSPEPVGPNDIVLVASDDLRLCANQRCWAA